MGFESENWIGTRIKGRRRKIRLDDAVEISDKWQVHIIKVK